MPRNRFASPLRSKQYRSRYGNDVTSRIELIGSLIITGVLALTLLLFSPTRTSPTPAPSAPCYELPNGAGGSQPPNQTR